MTIKQIQIAAPAKKPAAKKAPAKKAALKKDDKPKLGKGAEEPTAYFQSLERNRKGSMKVMQKQWKKAVKLAEEEGKGKKGPYIMRIFKNLMGISTATAEAGGLPGIGNEPTGVDTMAPPGGPVDGPAGKGSEHPFDVAGLTTPKTKDPKLADDAPFDYARWEKSGKPPRKSNLIRTNKDGKLELVPRKGLPKK